MLLRPRKTGDTWSASIKPDGGLYRWDGKPNVGDYAIRSVKKRLGKEVATGELIATPTVASDPDIDCKLLWFIILGCIIKVFVQIELGRYAISRGKTTIEAMDEMPGPRLRVSWLVWIWLFMFISLPFQVAGMYGGIAKMATLNGSEMNM